MLKLNHIVRNHHGLKPLLHEAESRGQLHQLWRLAAPEFQQVSQVIGLANGQLLVSVHSGAVASRIKLLESHLLATLLEVNRKTSKIKGLNLNAIRVKVQVKFAPPRPAKRIQAPSAIALSTLSACAEAIDNPALTQALKRFIRHQR